MVETRNTIAGVQTEDVSASAADAAAASSDDSHADAVVMPLSSELSGKIRHKIAPFQHTYTHTHVADTGLIQCINYECLIHVAKYQIEN